MTLRPILSDSLLLSTFEDVYSILKYTCLYLFYALKELILDINFKFYEKKPFSKIPKGWNILADRVRPQNNVGVRFLDNDIFLRLTAPSSCSTRLPNDQDAPDKK